MDRLRIGSAAPAVAPAPDQLQLSELIAALSHALDLTEGQPRGHCVRCCWIGMHVGQAMGLDPQTLWDLYYTLLLKDLGCSSNAARICELYLTDDREFKHDFKTVGESLPQMLHFIFGHTGARAGTMERLRAILNIMRNGKEIAQELIQTRCHRGADIARQLRFPESVARGVHSLDEHWNGQGRPEGLAGEQIPIHARLALLAQVVDVFYSAGGMQAALDETQRRAGSWLDPQLVQTFHRVAQDPGFWAALADPALEQRVAALEPGQHRVALDDDYLDDIAAAFGQVVDSKSPYTAGHSLRVAFYTEETARQLGLPDARRRWLQRAALLHDIGKLGVSNAILDKPGPLDDDEWVQMRRHAVHTREILSRLPVFDELAHVAGAHHERLDGSGYPDRLSADQIKVETRIITVADVFDALSAQRPYRDAMPTDRALDIMQRMVGTALDPLCFEALSVAVQRPFDLPQANTLQG